MRKSKSGLTMTIVFQASSANYGESLGNIAALKKLTRGDGQQYTYISRQALRYNIANELDEPLANLTTSGKGDKKVIQFADNASVKDFPELDFFGYMKTEKSKSAHTRSAKVRLSNAISEEPYASDTDFLTNLSLAQRIRAAEKDDSIKNSIAQSEIQQSYYCYTVTIDLDQIGIDSNDDTKLDDAEKNRRIAKLLDVIHYLYRDIRGRREDLKPLFIIGGIYNIKNPVFENVVHVKNNQLDLAAINSILTDPAIKQDTEAGLIDGIFANNDEIISNLKTVSVTQFINDLKKKVADFYEVTSN